MEGNEDKKVEEENFIDSSVVSMSDRSDAKYRLYYPEKEIGSISQEHK